MEYLQYDFDLFGLLCEELVLNLIINGIPSILKIIKAQVFPVLVLNLIINGIPSIPKDILYRYLKKRLVLNLIINGIPSIQKF